MALSASLIGLALTYTLAKNDPLEAQVAAALEGDKSGGPVKIPASLNYHSEHEGANCGNVCLKFLFDGGVETFTAHELGRSDVFALARSGGNRPVTRTIGSGRTYRLEKRLNCPNPIDEGVIGRSSTAAVRHSLAGTCIIGRPASDDDVTEMNVVFETGALNALEFERDRNSVGIKYKKQIKHFSRLWVFNARSDDKLILDPERVLIRRTKIRYRSRRFPPFYPSFTEKWIGEWGADKKSVDEINATTAALGHLSDFFPEKDLNRTSWKLSWPTDFDVLAQLTRKFSAVENIEARSRQAQNNWRRNVLFLAKHNKLKNPEYVQKFVPYAHSLFTLASRHIRRNINTISASEIENAYVDAALLEAAFHTLFRKRHTYVLEYKNGLDKHQHAVRRFEKELERAAIVLGGYLANSEDQLPRNLVPLVHVAVKVITFQDDPDGDVVKGIWAATLRTSRKPEFGYLLTRHGSKLPDAVDQLVDRYQRNSKQDDDAAEDLMNMLWHAPSEQLRQHTDFVISLTEQYSTSVFSLTAMRMLIRLGDMGPMTIPTLERFADRLVTEDIDLIRGALLGLCRAGPPYSEEAHDSARKTVSFYSDKRLNNVAASTLYAALKVISRANRMEEFLQHVGTADYGADLLKHIDRWLKKNNSPITAEQC